MVFDTNSVVSTPEILKRKLGGELFAPITIASSEFSSTDVVKAGSPIGADGTIQNDGDAVGILLNDVYVDNPNGSLIKGFATINEANAKANSNITLASTCKAALTNLFFE